MQGAKKTVKAVLDKLADNCSLEEVVYHLYVRQRVEAGLADVQAGRTISHARVAEELRRKWVKGTGR